MTVITKVNALRHKQSLTHANCPKECRILIVNSWHIEVIAAADKQLAGLGKEQVIWVIKKTTCFKCTRRYVQSHKEIPGTRSPQLCEEDLICYRVIFDASNISKLMPFNQRHCAQTRRRF